MCFYIPQDDSVCDVVEINQSVIIVENMKCQYVIDKNNKIISAYNGKYRAVEAFSERYAKRVDECYI
jgi:hypothetical protein